MNKEKTEEEQVIERYIQLAGLLKDGVMVNRDKEARAREYVRTKRKFIEQVLDESRETENTKYGDLIIQANDVQKYLIALVLIRAFYPTSSLEKHLEESTLGTVIGYFKVAAKIKGDVDLISELEKYKKARDRLAHKMFTTKKLTPQQCTAAIASGEKIIDSLIKSVENAKTNMLKGSDRLSEFPVKFNQLADEVRRLAEKVAVLERKIQKSQKSKTKS